MRKMLTPGFAGLCFIALLGCREEAKPETLEFHQQPAVQGTDASTGTADQRQGPAEPEAPASCSTLKIPSYDLVIKALSYRRCDLCHNENYAWRGIVLTKFESWKTYAGPIRDRILQNQVTEPLEPDEQKLFLTWIDAGWPRTEADCEQLQ